MTTSPDKWDDSAIDAWDSWYDRRDPSELKRQVLQKRSDRLYQIWRVLNRTFDDHLKQPPGMPLIVWKAMVPRFTVTDLASPVLNTINSATYGGKVTRRIRDAKAPVAEIEAFMRECRYEKVMPEFHRDAAAYGTSYVAVGDKAGAGGKRRGSLLKLPPLTTRIAVDTRDSEMVRAVVTDYGAFERQYTLDGIFDKSRVGEKRKLPNSAYGFIPVTIARGRWMDTCTPYGESLIWPAVEETKQVTALMSDLMTLERLQSYSTLVVKGNPVSNPSEAGQADWLSIRFGADNETDGKSDAYYVSPDAKIEEINKIIESKFERCATQCQVPVDIFVRAKSGTQQATGAAQLSYKPLYDLVIDNQTNFKEVERDLIAKISAFISFRKTGKPQDFQEHYDALELDIQFVHETHPAYNQAEVQTWSMMVSEGFVPIRMAREHFLQNVPNDQLATVIAEIEREVAEREQSEMDMAMTARGGDTGEV